MNGFRTVGRGLKRIKLLLLLAVAGFGSYTYYVTDGAAWGVVKSFV